MTCLAVLLKSVRTSPSCLRTGRSPLGVQKGLLVLFWEIGAPENLAKARILIHSGSTEGRPQSGDQVSSSITSPLTLVLDWSCSFS